MATQTRGLSLHIGLNRVDPTKYIDRNGDGWAGALATCETDAIDMAAAAGQQGLTPTTLLTAGATADDILEHVRAAAEVLGDGDLFAITFSGHGGSVPDTNGDESDGLDETWVTYDRQMIDDEIYYELSRFRTGVRVLMVSDSCHSGTISTILVPPPPEGAKTLSLEVAAGEIQHRSALYEQIQTKVPPRTKSIEQLAASVMLLAACTDKQYAFVGPRHSVYTGVFLVTWDKGRFQGTYEHFHEAICAVMPSYQTPQLSFPGPANPAFMGQRPLSL